MSENGGDEFAAASDAGLVKDRLEVVLHGVRAYVQPRRDLGSRKPLADQAGDSALSFGEAVGGHHHWGDLEWSRLLDDHSDCGLPLDAEPGSVQDGPAAGACSNAQPWLRQKIGS